MLQSNSSSLFVLTASGCYITSEQARYELPVDLTYHLQSYESNKIALESKIMFAAAQPFTYLNISQVFLAEGHSVFFHDCVTCVDLSVLNWLKSSRKSIRTHKHVSAQRLDVGLD